MAETIRVESVEALRRLRTAVVKFIDMAKSATVDAEMEVQQITRWVQNEQKAYWQAQVLKRQEAVIRARQVLRDKQLFKSVMSSQHAAVEEEKALAKAKMALEEAERKFSATVRWARRLPQDSMQYTGVAQRMMNQVDNRLPEAIARLDQMAAAIEAYLALAGPTGAAVTRSAGEDTSGLQQQAQSMALGVDAAAGTPGEDSASAANEKHDNGKDADPASPQAKEQQ